MHEDDDFGKTLVADEVSGAEEGSKQVSIDHTPCHVM